MITVNICLAFGGKCWEWDDELPSLPRIGELVFVDALRGRDGKLIQDVECIVHEVLWFFNEDRESYPVIELRLETDIAVREETDKPDDKGFVLNPLDPTAYIPLAKILSEHTPSSLARTIKQLKAILTKYPRVRRTRPKGKDGKPRLNRQSVHLTDWNQLKERLLTPPWRADGKETRDDD